MRQLISVTLNNLVSIPGRWGMAVVVVIGVAGVVAVLTSVMTMSFGLTDAAEKSAREGWAIVLRKGAFAEGVSSIPVDSMVAIEAAQGIDRRENGELAMDRHFVTTVSQPRRHVEDIMGSILVRGLSEDGLAGVSGFKLESGRMFETGKRELVVGILTEDQYKGVSPGQEIVHKGANWKIVGTFSTNGSAMESELLGDLTAVMSGMNSTAFSSARVRLAPGVTIDDFNAALEADPRLKVEAKTEKQYIDGADTGQLIDIVAFTVSIIMGIGAFFGALNVMYMAVSNRTREIATLRALGFSGLPVAFSVLVEAMLLAILGALVGLLITMFLFQGSTFTTGQLASISTVLRVTPEIAVMGVTWGCVIGFVGGLFPAIRAVRASIVDGLRSEL